MTLRPGIEPGTHWWEVSALITAPSLLMCKHISTFIMILPYQLTIFKRLINHSKLAIISNVLPPAITVSNRAEESRRRLHKNQVFNTRESINKVIQDNI